MMANEILVEMDHRDLAYLANAADVNDRLARWKWLLQLYRIKIVHIAGETNSVADALSRLDTAVDVIEVMDKEEFLKEIKEAQAKQPDNWKEELHLREDGVYVDVMNLAVVPNEPEMRRDIIKQCHGSAMVGHLGRDKTVQLVEEGGFTWNTIKSDVMDYINACAICQKLRLRHRINVELHTTMADMLWNTICVDSVGPLPEDKDTKFHYIKCAAALVPIGVESG